ncbi:TolC family protein [Rhodanobacter sp. OR444]|uniref:TolC family protein n=1 Tax=Rhodanobacter sp. OR444 TaxID=1076525 RepID=UPI00163A2639|nr:TolC family protein [Rhodanobacter sp. OR444]
MTHRHAEKRWCMRARGELASSLLPIALLLFAGIWQTAAAAPSTASASAITQPLSLDHAVQLALDRNPDVHSAENALQAAEAARRAAVGKLYPQIKALSWYGIYPSQNVLLLPGHMDIPTLQEISAPTAQQSTQKMLDFQRTQFQDSVFNIGLGLSWPLYAGGRLKAGVEGARAEAKAADYQLSYVRQQLVFAVTQTYLGIGVAERSEQAVQASIKHLTEAKSNLQTFVKVGSKPRLDLLRVEARLEQTQQLLADTQAALVTVRGNLRRLLDLDPSGPPLPLVGEDDVPDRTPAIPSLSAALDQVLANRPDYQALQSGVDAQRAHLRIAQGARLPEVDLSAKAWEAHGNRTGGPISTWEPDSQIMLSVSVPIFTGGTLRAQVHQQQARLDEMNDRLTSLEQQVRWEVTQAYAELHAAQTKVDAARAGMRSADEAFQVERQKATVGAGTVTDLLDAQAADLSAQTSFYQALAGVRVALTRAELAAGLLDRQSANESADGVGP